MLRDVVDDVIFIVLFNRLIFIFLVLVGVEIFECPVNDSLWSNTFDQRMTPKDFETVQRCILVNIYDVEVAWIIARRIRTFDYGPIPYLKLNRN